MARTNTLSARIPRISLRSRLMLLVGIVVVPILILLYHQNRVDREKDLATQLAHSRLLAQYSAASVGQVMSGVRNMIVALARSEAVRNRDVAGANQLFSSVLLSSPDYTNIGFVDQDGNIIASAVPFSENINFSDRTWFRLVQQGRTFSIGEFAIGRIAKVASVVCAYALPGKSPDVPRMILFVALKVESFQACIDTPPPDLAINHGSQRPELPQMGVAIVIDRNGTELARNPDPANYVGHKANSWLGLDSFHKNRMVETAGLDGVTRLYHYEEVPGSDESLFVAFGQPKEVAIMASDERFQRHLWQVGLCALAALCCAALVGEISVLQPVRRLTAAAQRLASGDTWARVEVRSGSEELYQLAKVFNRMAGSLQLQNEQLEQRVRERTAALQASNEALMLSEKVTRSLLDALPGAAILLDQDGVILDCNEIFGNNRGLKRDQLLGKSIFDYTPPALVARRTELLDQALRLNRTGRLEAEQAGRLFEIVIQPLSTKAETKAKIAVLATDITERRHLEERLRQAQKMEAIGQLAGGVAHDFNNILAAMILNIGLIKDDPLLTPNTLAGLKELEDSAHRAADLTKQLLLFSRRQKPQLVVREFNQMLRQLAGMLRRLIEERIQLVLDFGSEPVWLSVDPSMIDQMVINLCVNARDAIPHDGTITLTTAAVLVSEGSPLTRAGARPGRYLHLCVKDTGTGMSDEVRLRIFEPFFTTKDPGKGTGLGLASVDGIIKEHGGLIQVDSELGKGSTFHVYLPTVADPAPTEQRGRSAARRGTETILFVEDDAPVRLSTSRVMQNLGYEVMVARDGIEARRMWRDHLNEIDLLFTDMVMPEVKSGLDLAQQFRVQRPDLKVIVASGYSVDNIPNETMESQNIGYIHKPYEISSLSEKLRQMLDAGKSSGTHGATDSVD